MSSNSIRKPHRATEISRDGATSINASPPLATTAASLAGDLMETAEEIAEFLYGDRSRKSVRKVRYLAREVAPENRLPIFRLGNNKFGARRSQLAREIEKREAAATNPQTA